MDVRLSYLRDLLSSENILWDYPDSNVLNTLAALVAGSAQMKDYFLEHHPKGLILREDTYREVLLKEELSPLFRKVFFYPYVPGEVWAQMVNVEELQSSNLHSHYGRQNFYDSRSLKLCLKKLPNVKHLILSTSFWIEEQCMEEYPEPIVFPNITTLKLVQRSREQRLWEPDQFIGLGKVFPDLRELRCQIVKKRSPHVGMFDPEFLESLAVVKGVDGFKGV
jgi:hypothetical protein